MKTRTVTGRGSRSGAMRQAIVVGASLLATCLMTASVSSADVASDHPAAILVFPKLIVDTSNGLDTVVRISNVSDTELDVYCFYVNATPRCSLEIAGAGTCFPNRQFCLPPEGSGLQSGQCKVKWQETDFLFQLTKNQPTGWLVSGGEGLGCQFFRGVCSNDGTTSCAVDSECPSRHCVLPPCLPLDGNPGGRIGFNGQTNEGVVPISPQDPFIGELKCIAVDNGQRPIARNDLIGEVIIGRQETGPRASIDVSGYNAIGIPALEDICQENKICSSLATQCDRAPCTGVNNRDKTLVLGGSDRAGVSGLPEHSDPRPLLRRRDRSDDHESLPARRDVQRHRDRLCERQRVHRQPLSSPHLHGQRHPVHHGCRLRKHLRWRQLVHPVGGALPA